jgi:hypothetical protein
LDTRKTLMVLIFTGILFLFSGMVAGNSLAAAWVRANGALSAAKVVVDVANEQKGGGHRLMTAGDMEKLRKLPETSCLTYTSRPTALKVQVECGDRNHTAYIAGIDWSYVMFSNLELSYGSFFSPGHEVGSRRTAVVSETFAWDAFRTKNAVGNRLDIYGKPFIITGVYKDNASILDTLAGKGLPEVMISAGVMMELDETAFIDSFQVAVKDTGTLDKNRTMVLSALRKIGKSEAGFSMTDYNIQGALMKQKPQLFVFLLALLAIAALASYPVAILKDMTGAVAARRKNLYLSGAIRESMGSICLGLLKLALVITGSILLWKAAAFKPYIPPEYIPGQTLDTGKYVGLLLKGLQDFFQGAGGEASYAGKLLKSSDMLINCILLLSLTAGLFLLHTGLTGIKTQVMQIDRLLLCAGAGAVFSTAAAAAACSLCGLTPEINLKGVIIAWVYVSVRMLKACKKEKGESCECLKGSYV